MLAYALVGTNDAAKSLAFYDALIAEVGGKRALEVPRVTLYAGADGGVLFGIAEPFDGGEFCPSNGGMVAFGASSPEEVDRLYAKAIELGATDEGAPGPRENGDLKFYAGYFRDPVGNKLNFFHM